MKTAVAITLIIVGGIIVAAPIASDYLHRAQAAAVMGTPGITSVNLTPTLSWEYRLGCWALGSAMVVAAVFFSRGPRQPNL